jgi:hypothetical protein
LDYLEHRARRKEEKEKGELHGRQSDCYCVEVRKREEKTKRSMRKKSFG